jgi:hypothetical protein
LSGHAASLFKFSLELENIILAAFRPFEFSHSLGPEPKKPEMSGMSAIVG